MRQSLYVDSATHVSFARAARVYRSLAMAGRGHSLKSPAGTDVVADSPEPVRPFMDLPQNFFDRHCDLLNHQARISN